MFAPPTKHRESKSVSKKHVFSLDRGLTLNKTVIFFLFFVTSGTWTLKEDGGCTVSSDVLFSFDRYRVSCLSWMIKPLLAAKLNSNISSSERCSFPLLCRNERRQRTRAAWEAIKATVRASWRTELPGPRVTKWQQLLPAHSVSSVGGVKRLQSVFRDSLRRLIEGILVLADPCRRFNLHLNCRLSFLCKPCFWSEQKKINSTAWVQQTGNSLKDAEYLWSLLKFKEPPRILITS